LQSPTNVQRGSILFLYKRGNVDIGAKVYRTSSIKLLDRINEKKTGDSKEPIDMNVKIKQNEEPKLTIIYKDYHVEEILHNQVEKSKNIPLTVEKIKEQLDRLGNTRFYLNDIKIDLDDHLFMTHKDLNRLRRVALAKLEDEISNFNNRMKLENQDFNRHK